MKSKDKTIFLACSVFKHELDLLQSESAKKIKIKNLSSMLHMSPKMLDKKIEDEVNILNEQGKNIILVYGDCSPNIDSISSRENVTRLKGINCIEIFLGKDYYRKLRKEGAFFLMPEWTHRWEELFKHELKLSPKVAKEFMQEMHSKIVYIDTGQLKIPVEKLIEIEKYTGLKTEIIKVDFSNLRKSLLKSLDELDEIL